MEHDSVCLLRKLRKIVKKKKKFSTSLLFFLGVFWSFGRFRGYFGNFKVLRYFDHF